jgi:hypothetical protein
MTSRGAFEINSRVRERRRRQLIQQAEWWGSSGGSSSTSPLIKHGILHALRGLASRVPSSLQAWNAKRLSQHEFVQ